MKTSRIDDMLGDDVFLSGVELPIAASASLECSHSSVTKNACASCPGLVGEGHG